jgi:hypothetical protein
VSGWGMRGGLFASDEGGESGGLPVRVRLTQTQMVFVPMSRDEAQALRAGTGANHYRACAATPSLAASMESGTVMEQVEYSALSNAGVLALVLRPDAPRLVVAAEVRQEQVKDLGQPLGEVEVGELAWAQVRALFADEPDALEAVELAGKAVAGQDLTAAIAAREVAELLDGYDLLWFAPDELDEL